MRYKIIILTADQAEQQAKLLFVAASIQQTVAKLDVNRAVLGHVTVIAHTTAQAVAVLQRDPKINVQPF